MALAACEGRHAALARYMRSLHAAAPGGVK
jgi:hypothetical protein